MENKCNDLNILISYFEDRYSDNKIKKYYYVEFSPLKKNYYLDDAIKQGGFMLKYSFKNIQINTFPEVCVYLKNLLEEGKKEKVYIRILENNIEYRSEPEFKHAQTGLIFYNGKFLSKNRQLTSKENNTIFKYLIDNLEWN